MNNALIILILCSFFAGMLLIGYVTSKKTKTMSDFYIGGRTFGTFTTSATQIASAFGGDYSKDYLDRGWQFYMTNHTHDANGGCATDNWGCVIFCARLSRAPLGRGRVWRCPGLDGVCGLEGRR